MNPSSFSKKAVKCEEYAMYWESLVKWNGWAEGVTADALMPVSVSDFKHSSHAERSQKLINTFVK